MSIYLRAGAKVNLLLRVLGRSGDYHLLRSLVAFADFGDDLWVSENNDNNKDEVIWQVGSSVIGDALVDNILLRVLSEARGFIDLPYFRIDLLKRIPMGGGLGGGSSDAGILLNYLVSDYGLGRGVAEGIAKDLGSDIFVCMGGRASWLGGVGDDVIELGEFPSGVYCLLVSSGIGLGSGDVFGGFGGVYSSDLDMMVGGFGSYGDLLNYLHLVGGNDLWGSAVELCLGLEGLRDLMVGLVGVDYVGMSGSGSVMFGLFWDRVACEGACDFMLGKDYFAVCTELS